MSKDEVWVVMVVGQCDYNDCTRLVGLYSNEAAALTRATKTWEELESECYDRGEMLSDLLQVLVYKHPVVEGIV